MIAYIAVFLLGLAMQIVAQDIVVDPATVNPISWNLHKTLDSRKIDRRISPRPGPNSPVVIRAGMEIGKIVKVDVPNGRMAISASIILHWDDPNWRWNNSYYGDENCVLRPVKDAWSPVFQLINGDPQNLFRLQDTTHVCNFPSKISKMFGIDSNTSIVLIDLSNTFEVLCTFNVRNFPFDEHLCQFDFVGYMEVSKRLRFAEWKMDPRKHYNAHSEWMLLSVNSSYEVRKDSFGPSVIEVSHMTYTIKIKRRLAFYVLVLFIPAFILTALTGLIFILPSESGEKISLGVSILISSTVFQLLLYDTLPKSEDIPMFSIIMGLFQFLSSLSVVVTAWVLNIYHRPESQPIPPWLKTVVRTRRGAKPKKVVSPMPDDDHGPALAWKNGQEQEEERITWIDAANSLDWILLCIFIVLVILIGFFYCIYVVST